MLFQKTGNTDIKTKIEGEEKLMSEQKNHALRGTHNSRLGKTDTQDNEKTAAWMNIKRKTEHAETAVPGDDAVSHAKEWVDNGSRL